MELMHRSFALAHARTERLMSNTHLALVSAGIVIVCGLVLGTGELVVQSPAGTKIPDGMTLALVNLLAIHLG